MSVKIWKLGDCNGGYYEKLTLDIVMICNEGICDGCSCDWRDERSCSLGKYDRHRDDDLGDLGWAKEEI